MRGVGEGDVDQEEEVTMTTLMQKTRSRMVRWFRQITRPPKVPYRWYDPDNCDGVCRDAGFAPADLSTDFQISPNSVNAAP